MPRRYPGGVLLLALLLVVSMAIKLSAIMITVEPDQMALRREIVSALQRDHYAARTGSGNWWGAGLVSAQKGKCEIHVRDATFFGPDLQAVTARRMNSGKPVRYIRQGRYLSGYPRIGIEVAWRIQRELARLGWHYGIDPVLVVGARDGCWPDASIFRAVTLRYA